MIKIKKILVSQPQPDPEKSPYTDLIKKFNLKVDFFKFFKIVGIASKDFRKQKVNIAEHTAIIFTSKNAVDHYFRMCGELRIPISENLRYFCTTESIALYLQKYVIYRKRKVFFCNQDVSGLLELIKKHKTEKFLLPCTEAHKKEIPAFLEKENIDYSKAILYKTVSEDLTKIDIFYYDMFVFFSPSGIKSLFENYPSFKQEDKFIAVFGNTTFDEAINYEINPNIIAPSKACPSMTMAIDSFIEENHKAYKKQAPALQEIDMEPKVEKKIKKKK